MLLLLLMMMVALVAFENRLMMTLCNRDTKQQ